MTLTSDNAGFGQQHTHRIAFGKAMLATFIAATFLSSGVSESSYAATPQVRGQWMGAMGASGLRRFYASGSDFGELVNRAVSYQTAKRVFDGASQRDPSLSPSDRESHSDTWVIQNDSLVPVANNVERPVFIRALYRAAGRDEPGLVRSRADRVDLGVMYAYEPDAFVSVGIAVEEIQADIYYVEGRSRGQSWGPRFDAGWILDDTWSLGLRYDYLMYSGDSRVSVPAQGQVIDIARDSHYDRQYLQFDALARINSSDWSLLPDSISLSWRNSFQWMKNDYEAETDSLGRPVIEPFGLNEELGLFRTGLNSSMPIGDAGQWSAFANLTLDYEFISDFDYPIDDRASLTASAGIVYQIARAKRVQLVYDRYQHTRGKRTRNNFSLISVIDF